MIPFLDLKKVNQQYNAELKAACNRVIDSGWYIGGQELEIFEQNFAVLNLQLVWRMVLMHSS